jgi:hypothetical protein
VETRDTFMHSHAQPTSVCGSKYLLLAMATGRVAISTLEHALTATAAHPMPMPMPMSVHTSRSLVLAAALPVATLPPGGAQGVLSRIIIIIRHRLGLKLVDGDQYYGRLPACHVAGGTQSMHWGLGQG